jgi:hypothetical protein
MTGGQVLDAYLREVTAALPGPARARADIVAELRSGLLDALDAHRGSGLTEPAAAAAATAEFGDPRQVAELFRPELAARHARRTALTLIPTGPLIGLLWAAAALASHIAVRQAPPWQWAGAPPGSAAVFPLALAAVVIAIWAGLITVAAAGPLTRWLPRWPRLAPTTAAICGLAAMTADIALFALLASKLASTPGTLAPIPVTGAAIASLTRLAVARRAARCCLAARALLPAP